MSYASIEEAWGEHFTNKKTKKSRKKSKSIKETFKNSSSLDDNIIEQFENFNENVRTSDDYVYEMSPEEEDNEVNGYNENNDLYEIQDNVNRYSESKRQQNNQEQRENNRNNRENNQSSNIELNNQSFKSEIEKLNNKINFILEKIKCKDNQDNDNNEDNSNDSNKSPIYDMILFIILGIFIILVLDSITKLVIHSSSIISVPRLKIPNLND